MCLPVVMFSKLKIIKELIPNLQKDIDGNSYIHAHWH